MNIYEEYKSIKKELQEAKNKEDAPMTLEWYEKISAMLENDLYSESTDFLFSILKFIETHEYLTDKQKIAVEELENQMINYSSQKWTERKNPF